MYEFNRFVKIIEQLDAPSKIEVRPSSPVNRARIFRGERDLKQSDHELQEEFIAKFKNSRSSVLQNLFFFGYKSAVNELAAQEAGRLSKKKSATFGV